MDSISYYEGIKPTPVKHISWQAALIEIQSGKHRTAIERARLIKDPDLYRKFKTNLPAVTFCGTFNGKRNIYSILKTTGFIVPDLDHVRDVDRVFNLLAQDEKVWFAFRSPSGEGIKCGLRAKGISTDEDHKRFFRAVDRYFGDIYGIEIDPACKDISRLTFLSYDEEACLNPAPVYFSINQWEKGDPVKPKEFDYKQYDTSQLAGKEKYAAKVLESCCENIRESVIGTKHCVRLKMSRLVGGYLNYLSEGVVLGEMESAIIASGTQDVRAAMKTVRDGIEYGKASPITIEDVAGPFYDVTDITPVTDVTQYNDRHKTGVFVTPVTECNAAVTPLSRDVTPDTRFLQGSLIDNLRLFCEQNQGATFTSSEIDREFGIVHPKDKNARRQAISRLKKDRTIIQDKLRIGVYIIPKKDVGFIDLLNTVSDDFSINLPFDLSHMANIPKKSIIVIAGTQNAGKTAIALNLIKMNLSAAYPLLYLMSEMGPSEYRKRVEQMDVDLPTWASRVQAADVPTGFGPVIDAHNPDGLTVIDYLEDKQGEYFKIASDIRNVYDSLGTGVAVICLQKKTTALVGRGGEATAEKARLYLTLDTLAHQPRFTVSALRILKAKDYPDENPNGKELHIKILRGHTIEPMNEFGDWQYCNQAQRAQYVKQYEHMLTRNWDTPPEETRRAVARFHTRDGPVFLNQKDFDGWREIYNKIDVMKEIRRLEDWTTRNPNKWTKKGWFFAISTALREKQDKATGG